MGESLRIRRHGERSRCIVIFASEVMKSEREQRRGGEKEQRVGKVQRGAEREDGHVHIIPRAIVHTHKEKVEDGIEGGRTVL